MEIYIVGVVVCLAGFVGGFLVGKRNGQKAVEYLSQAEGKVKGMLKK